MSCCEVLWLWGRRRGPRRLLSRVQCSVFRRCGRCAGSMIPRAHICSGALLACWWHKPCPYVAMMFDVYVWCMCVEAQETQLISRWRRASPTSCRPFTQGGGGRPFLLSYGHGRYVLRGPAQGARGAAPLKTWHVRAPRPPATRIWRWSELFGQQSRLRRRDSRRWLDKLRMSTMPSVSRGVASHRYNGRKSGATTAELDAQWRKFSAGCCVPPSKWSATARWMASGVGTCMVFACCARVPSSSARRACARARTAVAASGLLNGSGASPRPALPARRTQHRHGHATCLR